MSKKKAFIVIMTAADMRQVFFQSPTPCGCFFSLEKAKDRMEKLIKKEKEQLNPRYDAEEINEHLWYMYEEGNAPDLFTRIEIIESEIEDSE